MVSYLLRIINTSRGVSYRKTIMFKRKQTVCKRHQQRLVKKSVESVIANIATASRSYSSETFTSQFDFVESLGSDSNNEPSQYNKDKVSSNISNYTVLPSTSRDPLSLHTDHSDMMLPNLSDNSDTESLKASSEASSFSEQEQEQISNNNGCGGLPQHDNNFSVKLSNWALSFKVPQNALSDLLKILKEVPDLSYLPSDARTLLVSPRELKFKHITPGQYYHFGLKTALIYMIQVTNMSLALQQQKVIEICVNVDGIPLTKSSGSQFYPILCNLFIDPNIVGLIGIYHGYEKPRNANEFLHDFVTEAIDLIHSGLNFNNIVYSVVIKAFICDIPAKTFITFTTGHMGYNSCSKCYIKGKYFNNRICFPSSKNEPGHLIERTDYEFRIKSDPKHHTGTSVLETIPNFNMVKGVVLDYMHLICLGTMRKLLYLWCFDSQSGNKLSPKDILKISELLLFQKSYIPLEFNRKPRSLSMVKRWKATEFRQFLFYTGPVVLKMVLSPTLYQNFLALSVACTLLTNPKFAIHTDLAQSLLKYFVDSFTILYGEQNVSHNIHNLLHIAKDVNYMGVLDKFSAFPFENMLQKIKNLLRKGDNPLAQVVKRISEINRHQQINNKVIIEGDKNFEPKRQHDKGPLIYNTTFPQFEQLIWNKFTLKIFEPDNCYTSINGNIITIQNFATMNDKIVIIGYKYLEKQDFFGSPCKSSDLNIYSVRNSGPLQIFSVEDVLYKCVKLHYKDSFVVMPLLHTDTL